MSEHVIGDAPAARSERSESSDDWVRARIADVFADGDD